MCKRLATTCFFIVFFAFFTQAQECTTRGQNPSSAFPVCGTSVFNQINVPQCGGRSVPGRLCDYALNDINPFWYKFTCFQAGTLGFTIKPILASDDYDWQLYDVTGKNIDVVYTDSSTIVASNWSGEKGYTGTSALGLSVFNCGGGGVPLVSAMPTLIKDHNYLLLVSNFSPSQQGYSLAFDGGTAVITDPIPPKLNVIYALCRNTSISIKINKNIKCSSVAPDGSDFSISPSDANIITATGFGCSAGFDTDSIVLTLDKPLGANTYTIDVKNGSDGNTLLDYCDESLPFSSTQIIVASVPVVTTASSNSPVCEGENLTLSTPDLTEAFYNWSGPNGFTSSERSPIITSAALKSTGTYTVFATGLGGCISTNITVDVTVNPMVTPSIAIVSDKTNLCDGDLNNFKATAANGGTSPVYQWKLNGNNVGSNSDVFSSSTLKNGDVISCEFTSSEFCATQKTVTSNSIALVVNENTTPTINISANNSSVCAGTNIVFTPLATNSGTNPVLQWQVNNITVETNTGSFSTSSLKNGDVVTCVVTSNKGCNIIPNAVSNAIKISVQAVVTPTINITSSSTIICVGTAVNFTANISNGGSAPFYQWKINGANVSANSATYSNAQLANNDKITCTLTNSDQCATVANVESNIILMDVSAPVIPTVSIIAPLATFCEGATTIITATPQNGGNSPTYQWKLNGNIVNGSQATYSNVFKNGDLITCMLTSNAGCTPSGNTALSNSINIATIPIETVTLSVAASQMSICEGTEVLFTATPSANAGASPQYQWQINSSNAGTGNKTFSTSSLKEGDIVSCTITPDDVQCPVTPFTVSNTVAVTVNPIPVVNAGKDTIVILGSRFQLNGTATGDIIGYAWSPSQYLDRPNTRNPFVTPASAVTYTLQATGAGNCKSSDDISILVLPKIKIPNVFSPNNDGINDLWMIDGLQDYKEATVEIFDRFGQVVFKSTGYNHPWDGFRNGKPLPRGVYYFIVNPKVLYQPLTGSITILR